MDTTPLSTILDNMNTFQDIANIEEQFKVRQLDYAIRKLRRKTQFPWQLKKGTIRIFDGIKVYPTASDHDELAYIDKQNIQSYSETARLFSTSLKQFFEDVNSSRNLFSEIWDNGTKMLGLKIRDNGLSSQKLSSAETASEYTAADDASAIAADIVNFIEGNGSISFVLTNNVGVGSVVNTIPSFSDSEYKKKYHFKWVYLSSVPANATIELRLRTDASNYLSSGSLSAQFSGQAFKANDWNLIAYDLNTATEVGTFDSSVIASEEIVLTGFDDGTYWLDASYLREWKLYDYWYYTKNSIQTESETNDIDQEYFMLDDGSYNISDKLVGDSEWIGVVQFDALMRLVAEVENVNLFAMIAREQAEAWKDFNKKYPDMVPAMTTQRYRFNNYPQMAGLNNYYRNT